MTKACTMVDVVAAKTCTHQFLKQIGFFIASFGTSISCQCTTSIVISYFFQTGSSKIEGFLPFCFTKYLFPFFWIEQFGRFGDAFFADQRFGQPRGMMNVIKTISSFNTKPTLIGWPLSSLDTEQFSFLDMII